MKFRRNFLRQPDPRDRAILKGFRRRDPEFACEAVLVGDKANNIAVIFVQRSGTRRKARLVTYMVVGKAQSIALAGRKVVLVERVRLKVRCDRSIPAM